MPAIQNLKKQLRSIRSTQKLTKAMKTISSIKFSKLGGIYNGYSEYANQCKLLLANFGDEAFEDMLSNDKNAPPAIVVLGTNKGLCGNFNSMLLSFAYDEVLKYENRYLITVGKKAASFFRAKGIAVDSEYSFGDVPTERDARDILNEIVSLRLQGKVSKVYIVFSHYKNMLIQQPTVENLFPETVWGEEEDILFVPDRKTVAVCTADKIITSIFYSFMLESALGAQAATLMSMRSAYETATEYSAGLEKEINRIRQSTVTADVLETFSERE